MTIRIRVVVAVAVLVGLPGCAVLFPEALFPELHEKLRAYDRYHNELFCNDYDLRTLLPGEEYWDKPRQEECDRLRPLVTGAYKPVAGFERAWVYDPVTGTARSAIIRSGSAVPAGSVVIPRDALPVP